MKLLDFGSISFTYLFTFNLHEFYVSLYLSSSLTPFFFCSLWPVRLWQRQKLVQAANGVETAVVDGKTDIENGNVPEDKPSEEEESELTSPFSIPREST